MEKYRKEIWQGALTRVREKYDARVEIMKMVLGTLFVLLVIIILIGFGLWNETRSIPNFLWGLFGANLLTILATIFSIPIMAFFDMWNVASDRDKAQIEMIDELEKEVDGLTKGKVESANITVEKYKDKRLSPQRVGVVISNHNKDDDLSIYIKPISVNQFAYSHKYGWQKVEIRLDKNTRFYLGDDDPIVEAQDDKAFAFVEIQDKEVVFLFNSGRSGFSNHKNFIFPPYISQSDIKMYKTKWELTFEIRGKKSRNTFKRETYKTEIISSRALPAGKYNEKFDTVTIKIGDIEHVQSEEKEREESKE